MKILLIVVLIAAYAACSVSAADNAEDTTLHPGCDKGKSYYDGCNTCTCINLLGKYACSRRLCPPEITTQSIDTQRQRREIDVSTGKYDPPTTPHLNILRFAFERCTPNEVKNVNCNRCKCVKSGKGWLCTRKVCQALSESKVDAQNTLNKSS